MQAILRQHSGKQKLLIKIGQAGEIAQLAELFRKLADGLRQEAELKQEFGMALQGTEAVILQVRSGYGKFMQDVQVENGRVIWKADAEDWRDNADMVAPLVCGHQCFGGAIAAVEVEVSCGEECTKAGVNWKLEIARLEFGLRRIESIPELACDALQEGQDTPSLRILAGLNGSDTDDTREYMKRAVEELGIVYPTLEESGWEVIRYFIDGMISGEVDPVDALRTIIWRVYHRMDGLWRDTHYVADGIGFHKLYGLYWEFDDVQEAAVPKDTEKTDRILGELKTAMIGAARVYRDGILARRFGRRVE
jgi:hypothetical protein